MIVIDASALVDFLFDQSPEIADFLNEEAVYAPHLIDLEVTHTLRAFTLRKVILPARAQLALQDLSSVALERFPHEPLLDRVWDLRHNLTAYDAAYLALAEVLQVPLLTGDRRLAEAAAPYAGVIVPRRHH